jgi:predicted RNase H-like nuclease (RuvC/YqgF family)
MKQKLLIVGIDPGTTAAYSILDISGKVIKTGSKKEFPLSELISEVIKYGKPLIVGCDKNPAPEFVEKFATKVGAKLIVPGKDILVEEKKELTKDIETANMHELDALASSLYAFKSIKPLLDKIDRFLAEGKKQNIADEVKEIVLINEIAIMSVIDIVEELKSGKTEESKIIRKVIEERKLTEQDFISLYAKLRAAEKDISLLKKQNLRLESEAYSSQKRLEAVEARLYRAIPVSKIRGHFQNKEKSIANLEREIDLRNSKISSLNNKVCSLHKFLSFLNPDLIILKKLDNLGYLEYQKKNNVLNISHNDILLVDDLDISSNEAIQQLRDKVSCIVYRKASKKTQENLQFSAINAKDLGLSETEYFACASKSELEKQKNKLDMLKKVVEEYRQER